LFDPLARERVFRKQKLSAKRAAARRASRSSPGIDLNPIPSIFTKSKILCERPKSEPGDLRRPLAQSNLKQAPKNVPHMSSPELGRGFGLQKQKPLAKSF
jgi:hypothetical protein